VHSARYPKTHCDALTASAGTEVRASWPGSGLAPVKAAAQIALSGGQGLLSRMAAREQPRYAACIVLGGEVPVKSLPFLG